MSQDPADPRKKRRRQERIVTVRRSVGDLIAILAGFWAAAGIDRGLGWIGFPGAPWSETAQMLRNGFAFAAVCLPTFWWWGLYRPRASVLNLWELSRVTRAVVIASGGFLALTSLLPQRDLANAPLLVGLFTTLLFLLSERRLVAGVLRRLQIGHRLGRRVLIVGSGETGRQVMKKIIEAPHMNRTVVGFLDDQAKLGTSISCRTSQNGREPFRAHVIGRIDDLERALVHHDIDEVLVDERVLSAERLDRVIRQSDELRFDLGIIPQLGEFPLHRLQFQDLSTIPLLRPLRPRNRRFYPIAKRGLDLVGAAGLLVLTAPVWGLIALVIRLDSPGPILFRQTRVGKGGATFEILKFRSMWLDVSSYANSPDGDSTDGRITRVGRILRLTGLDELPQLVNVLRGEMSLVGPRPEMPFIVAGYGPLELGRLRVLPGITGVWQLSPDRHAQIHESIEYDLYYVQHRTMELDLLLLLDTGFHTVGAAVGKLFSGLPRRRRTSLASAAAAVLRPLPLPAPERPTSAAPSPEIPRMPRPRRRPPNRRQQIREAPANGLPANGLPANGLPATGLPANGLPANGSLVPSAETLKTGQSRLLVALDQRGTLERETLSRLLGIAYAVSCRWPVQIAVSEGNRWAFSMLLEEASRADGRGLHRAQVQIGWGETHLSALARDAALVWTNVAEVADWVRHTGVDVLETGRDVPSVEVSTASGRRLATEVLRWLSAAPEGPHPPAALRQSDGVRSSEIHSRIGRPVVAAPAPTLS